MRIMSRLLLVVVLLGGLACGSYAFGKYVLSTHLMNTGGSSSASSDAVRSSVGAAKAVTRQTEFRGDAPKVEVRVLPAGDDGEGPPPPGRNEMLRHNEKTRNLPNDEAADAEAERKVQEELAREEERLADEANNRRHNRASNSRDAASPDEPVSSERRSRTSEGATSAVSQPIEPEPRDDGTGGVFKNTKPSKPKTKKPKTGPLAADTSMVPVPEGEATRAPRSRPRTTVVTDSPVPKPEGGSESPVPRPE